MKRFLVFLVFGAAFLAAAPAWAADAAKRQKIVELMSASGTIDQFHAVYPVLEPQVMEQLRLLAPQLTEKHMTLIKEEMAIEFEASLDEFMNSLVPLYDEAFSHEEIDAILAFMNSDIGRKLKAKTPAIMQAAATLGAEWGRQVGVRAGARATEKLRELGYEF